MRSLCIALFSIAFLFSANAIVTINNGTYLGDWQNVFIPGCSIQSLTFATYEHSGSVTLAFTQAGYNLCKQQFPSWNLPAALTSVTLPINDTGSIDWIDTNGNSIHLNTDGNISYVLKSDTSVISTLLFTTTGAAFPQQDTLGSIGGIWNTPVPLAGTTPAPQCCVPDFAVLELYGSNYQINAQYAFTSLTTQCNNNTANYSVLAVGTSEITWTNGSLPTSNITYNPNANLTNVTISFSPTCQYTYQKANPATLTFLDATWTRDWQSATISSPVPSTYQVTTVHSGASTYMTSTLTYITNGVTTTSNSYIVQTPQGTYYDAIGFLFNYNPTLNTLFYEPMNQLYSPNGNIVPSTPFLGTWNTPIELFSHSLEIGCCVPSTVVVSNNGTGQAPLDIAYQFPSTWSNTVGCQDFITDIDNVTNTMSSTLNLAAISFANLTWNDSLTDATVYMTNTQLAVSGFPGNCSFAVTLNVNPTPPAPLSSALLSTGIVSLMAGLFIVFAN